MRNFFGTKYVLAALAASAAMATPAAAKSDTQYWQTLQATVKLDDHVVLSNETVFRSGDAKGFYEIENNAMIGYKFDKHITAYLGYTADPQYLKGHYTTMENRIRQQVSFDNVLQIGTAKLSGRLRMEERWRDNSPGTAWRLRPQVKLSIPLHGKTALNLTHESFIDLNTTGFQKVSGYERMRNAIAINTPIAKHFNIEFGYLEQHGFVPNGADNDDHVATIALNASF
ncbi:MAG: DUF2490 domain-containing protein [Novosphingobium sp.]